jgi:ferredoxin
VPTCIIQREECTSCGNCWDLCPEFFEENPNDSLSQIVDTYRQNELPGKGEISDEMMECVRDAADSCPVQIILIEE